MDDGWWVIGWLTGFDDDDVPGRSPSSEPQRTRASVRLCQGGRRGDTMRLDNEKVR